MYAPELIGLYAHADPKEQKRIIAHCEKLGKELKREGISAAEQINLIARIHWWYANMTAWERGSAGNSDALAKALFFENGFELGRWKKNVVPDLEALGLNNEEEFVAAYPSFFELPPRKQQIP